MKADIYFNSKSMMGYDGEGHYVLVREDGKCVADAICSNRDFAEQDLTRGERRQWLIDKDVTEVYSHGRLIWEE